MRASAIRTIVVWIAALGIVLSTAIAPAIAARGAGRMGGFGGYHSGFGGCGLFPCRSGWHGGYGGWRGGYAGWHGGYYHNRGYWGWGPAFGIGLLGGYYGASSYYSDSLYYGDDVYYDGGCIQHQRVYDRWGHYLGWQRIYVC